MASCGAKKNAKKDDEKNNEQENYNDGLTPQQRMDAIKNIFIKADTDGDKLLDVKEWFKCSKLQEGLIPHNFADLDEAAKKKTKWACMKEDAQKAWNKKAKKVFNDIDKSLSGTISLAEMDLWVTDLQMKAVRTRFKAADDDGNRSLNKKEFYAFFDKEGMKKKSIGMLWKKCDKNGDGKVTYSEFSDWMEREMADGVLAETFKDSFEKDNAQVKKENAAQAKKNQDAKDAKTAKANKKKK